MQLGLFAIPPAISPAAISPAAPAAPAAPRKLIADLKEHRAALARAEADLLDTRSNLGEIRSHYRQHIAGGIDANWVDGGMRFGLLDGELLGDGTALNRGRYPIAQVRWIRHMLAVTHAEVRDTSARIAALRGETATLESKLAALGIALPLAAAPAAPAAPPPPPAPPAPAAPAPELPRKRHSHRCLSCSEATYCYKSRCTRPQRAESCVYCERRS